MTVANLKRLQAISHRVHTNKSTVEKQFIAGLRDALGKRGYRADLAITTDAKSTVQRFTAAVAFDTQLGHPSEEDLVTLAARAYPTHEIDWELADVDSERGIVLLSLNPSTEIIPIASVNAIPPEFTPIGTGIYKRALDSTVNEIWTLRRGEDGLVLYRNDDVEVTAKEEGLKAGDLIATEQGPGRILRFDDMGNAYVQVAGQKKLMAASELKKYDINKEKSLLTSYYESMYGDSNMARDLTKDYTTRKDTKKDKKDKK